MKIHAIIFTLGLLLGLFFSFMHRTLLIDLPKPPVSKKSVVELKKEVANNDAVYAKSFDSLKKQSTTLNNVLSGTKKSLQTAKRENIRLTTKVKLLIGQQTKLPEELSNDNSCDSLITTVEHLIVSNLEKDSLYEAVTDNLTSLVANKDSTITLKDEHHLKLKSILDKSLSTQQSLIDENKLLGRQVRKQKVKGKLLSAALFIISGAAINQFIRR